MGFYHKTWCKKYRRSVLLGLWVLLTTYSVRRYINFKDRTQYSITGRPANHIAFIKVPKTASTTVQNIFLRYGDEKNLIFALPRKPPPGIALTTEHFFPPPTNRTYDITCAHVRYNRTDFSRALPRDTIYIGTVRQPFSHFRSQVRFSLPQELLRSKGENPVLTYLSKSVKQSHVGQTASLCNIMTRYYGINDTLYLKMDQRQKQQFLFELDKLGKELDIVLILEHLDESIVFMRRLLNWDLRHVLYGKLRTNPLKDDRLKFGPAEEKLHRNCAHLDYLLYDFFVRKLKDKIKGESPDFFEELAYFKKTRIKYDNFCLSSLSDDSYNTSITFDGSAWNKPFVITRDHCKKLHIHALAYLELLRIKQHAGPPEE